MQLSATLMLAMKRYGQDIIIVCEEETAYLKRTAVKTPSSSEEVPPGRVQDWIPIQFQTVSGKVKVRKARKRFQLIRLLASELTVKQRLYVELGLFKAELIEERDHVVPYA